MGKVLACIDGSEISDRVLTQAVERVKKEGGELVVLYVVEDFCPIGLTEIDCDMVRELLMKEAKVIIDQALAKVRSLGVEGKGVIKEGRPADVIVEFAKEEGVDEIFIGSHGRHGAKKVLLGSVSSRVVEYATCPVTVIK
ncbi:MAG: universal stress protein [Caldimicrobium sp.]|nr:universal stress protein [Caldimicrobium sp.]MCX7613518.1 universal stress protein [Caldimicrobium sp.]MDW8182558.1 universal stress protein [Caldimicrobium sp.]